MKRILIALLFLLAPCAHAQISMCVNTGGSAGFAGTTQQVSFGAANTAGRGIIASVEIANTTDTPTASDSRGNSYSQARRDTGLGLQLVTFFATNIAAGANTVTISGINDGSYRRLVIAECPGITNVDQTAGASGTSTTPSSGNVTTTQADELIYGFAFGNAGGLTVGAGFTLLGAPDTFGRAEARVVSSTGTYAADWTQAASEIWLAHVVTFYSSGAPPPPPISPRVLGIPIARFPELAAPSNPPSGYKYLYADSSTGDLKCIDSAGGNCFPIVSSPPSGGGPANVQIADQFAGADYCAKVQTAITALGGGGFVDARGLRGTSICAGTFTVSRGVTLYVGNWDITPNSTITLNQDAAIICDIGQHPDLSKSCIFRAKNALDSPVIRCVSDAGPSDWCHWSQIIGIRVEGNSAGQTVRTIAAAPSGASRVAGVTTITTTASHGFTVGEVALVFDVADTTFNGAFTIASTTATTFTYNQPNETNASSGGGTANSKDADCIRVDRPGENFFIDRVSLNSCRHSALRIVGNMAGANASGSVGVFGSGIGINFDEVVSTHVGGVWKGDGNRIFARFKAVVAQGGCTVNVTGKMQWENTSSSDHEPGILVDQTDSGCTLYIAGLFPGGGTAHNDLIKCFGVAGCNFGVRALGTNTWYTNIVNDLGRAGGARVYKTRDFANPFGTLDAHSFTYNGIEVLDGNLSIPHQNRVVNNGANNDWPLGTGEYSNVRFTGATAEFGFTGLSVNENPAGCTPDCIANGRLAIVQNSTTQNMFFDHENASSNAIHRIVTKTGKRVNIGPSSTAILIYSKADNRWHLINDPYPGTTSVNTDLDTTPSVAGVNTLVVTNSGATTITMFDDGYAGQIVRLIFTDGNTTLSDAGNLKLAGGFTSTADDTLTLVFDGTNWYELSRSVN